MTTSFTCEAEIAPGLETIAVQELQTRLSKYFRPLATASGLVRFTYSGDLEPLFDLKTINAIYLLLSFDIPRPKALLGHQYFHALLEAINQIRRLHPADSFSTLNIDAAGSDSSVMVRLKSELANRLGLQPADDKGDLLIRLRRTPGAAGWDVLIRLTPRPLATRPWRVQNYEGALNAAVAHAIVRLTQPDPADIFLNLGCGSGTLLIERFAAGQAQQIIGCDLDAIPLTLAVANAAAAGVNPELLQADARQLSLSDASIDKLCADLPFGQLVGSHSTNTRLYPALLIEAARVARQNAPFVIITHEIRLMETLLRQSRLWLTTQTIKITLNGLHPRIYVLKRS
ncbi:MAG: methyltransferase domain-containing protein [Anaerolineae bacterium]|nr:methyltransferase domain-containing protein [Anaerolineae bacterium]